MNVVLQLALVYGGSLCYKSWTGYMVDAHTVRSTLLQEVTGIRDGLLFPVAVRMATHPWMGPCLSRVTWLAEACTALGALLAVLAVLLALCGTRARLRGAAGLRVVNTVLLPPALVASTALQLGIVATCRIGFYPVVMMGSFSESLPKSSAVSLAGAGPHDDNDFKDAAVNGVGTLRWVGGVSSQPTP